MIAPPVKRVDAPSTEPPAHFDLDAEAAVLSAVILDPLALDTVKDLLRPEHFYSEAHRRIHEVCVDLSAEGRPIDVVLVASRLRENGRLAQVGGMAYLTAVLNAAPAVIERHLRAYCEAVGRHARTRKLIARFERAALELRRGEDVDAVLAAVARDVEAA
jgi:replicative DNA helicase